MITPHEWAMTLLDLLEPGDYTKEELLAKLNMILKLQGLTHSDSAKCLRSAISVKRKKGLKLETIREGKNITYRKKGQLP